MLAMIKKSTSSSADEFWLRNHLDDGNSAFTAGTVLDACLTFSIDGANDRNFETHGQIVM